MTVYYFMIILGAFVYVSESKHVLIMLMGLEFMLLVIFLLMVDYLCNMGGENQFLLVYMIFVVCESVVALGVLVSMIRSYGNDYFSSLCLLSC